MNSKDQDREISKFRKEAIRKFNMDLLEKGESDFMRERKSGKADGDTPVMCSGCFGFFAKSYKARHQLICPSSGTNVMLPVVSIEKCTAIDKYCNEFKELLSKLLLDEIGDYVKTDEIILMIAARSFGAMKRKKDKIVEGKRTVRSRMPLLPRIYLCFREFYNDQTEVILTDPLNNAGDVYRREAIGILGSAVNSLAEKPSEEVNNLLVTGQKSGLKVGILNLLKRTAKFMIGYFLVKNLDVRSQRVVEFLQVLKLFEDEIFGDAYYDISYRRNVNVRKPINLPKDEDAAMLMEECKVIMNSIDAFAYPSDLFTNVRAAVATALIIFNARRGGEPVRLQLFQWQEAINGEWVDKDDVPNDFNGDTMLITYQTVKGSDHLVPVLFPPETLQAMKFLTNNEVRKNAGVHDENPYIFASTKNSKSHASGWHSINDILKRLSLTGLKLSDKEKEMIYKHFGHSEHINQNVYQAPPGSVQLQTTGQRLMQINDDGNSRKEKSSSERPTVLMQGKGSCKKYYETPTIVPQPATKSMPLRKKKSSGEPTKSTSTERDVRAKKSYSFRSKSKTWRKKEFSYGWDKDDETTEESESDYNDITYEPPNKIEKDNSASDFDVSDSESRKRRLPQKENAPEKKRTYYHWSEEAKKAFSLDFKEYVEKDRGYPSRLVLEEL